MTRLIPGHEVPVAESSQVTALAVGAAAVLAEALATVLDHRPAGSDAPGGPRSVPRLALAAEEGAPGGHEGPSRGEPAGPSNLGTVGLHRPSGALVPVAWGDTPEPVADRLIGHAPSPSGPPPVGAPAGPPNAPPTVPAAAAGSPERAAGSDPSDVDLVAGSSPSRVDPAQTDQAGTDLASVETDAVGAPVGRASVDLAAARRGPDLAAAADITSGLWADYLTGRSTPGRDRLVVHYRGLVRAVAGKLAGGLPAHVDAADLVQVGMFGLIDAVERFDPAREVRFESYAAQRIRGAMLDELRTQDWVPRTARARRREIDRTRERLELERGATASDEAVAAELGIALRELRAAKNHRRLVSVEALEAGAPGPVTFADLLADDTAPDPVEVAEYAETVRELVGAVADLEERDRQVVQLYYLENRTLAEIGRVLGVTESRVCQLHSRLVTRLRGRLASDAAG